jgi:RimJ/RimL family protein N-acetyltransferase
VYKLRLANNNDIRDLNRFARKFFEHSPYAREHFDRDKVEAVIRSLVNADRTSSTVIVCESEGRVIGVIAGTATTILFNNDKVASEIMWWVEPEHRRSRAGMDLLMAFEAWADYAGCEKVQMIALDNDYSRALDTLYRRKNYVRTEQAYFKGIT